MCSDVIDRCERRHTDGQRYRMPGGSIEAYQWFFDDGSGYIELPNITAAITASTPGLYKVVITCGDCTAGQQQFIPAVTPVRKSRRVPVEHTSC